MATDEQLVSDGSGSTASSTRASAPSLIFAILLLINALVLLISVSLPRQSIDAGRVSRD